MHLTLPTLDPDRAYELSGLQRVQASVRLRREEVQRLAQQHQDSIRVTELNLERQRLQVAHLAEELVELQRLERWLRDDRCALCPPDSAGCESETCRGAPAPA
jgi:hypothetical protein